MLKKWKPIHWHFAYLSFGFIGFLNGHNLMQGIVVNNTGFGIRQSQFQTQFPIWNSVTLGMQMIIYKVGKILDSLDGANVRSQQNGTHK